MPSKTVSQVTLHHRYKHSTPAFRGEATPIRLPSKVIPPCHPVSYWLNALVRAHTFCLQIGLSPEKMPELGLHSYLLSHSSSVLLLAWIGFSTRFLCRKLLRLCVKSAEIQYGFCWPRKEYRGSYLTQDRD